MRKMPARLCQNHSTGKTNKWQVNSDRTALTDGMQMQLGVFETAFCALPGKSELECVFVDGPIFQTRYKSAGAKGRPVARGSDVSGAT